MQFNQGISLKNARELTVKLDAYNDAEKNNIDKMYKLMLSEFEEE